MSISTDQHAFFERAFACSADVARAIGARAGDKRFAAKALIVRQGDPATETFLLMDGCAHALRNTADGQFALLQEFLPGDIFGAVAQLDAAAHPSDVMAVEPSRTAVFLVFDFVALIEAHASVGLAVSRLLLRQLRAATDRMAERVILSATGRIHAELLRLARQGDGRVIRPLPVLAAMAVRVHTTRETVSREISTLERRGLLRREPDALILTAPQRLEDMLS